MKKKVLVGLIVLNLILGYVYVSKVNEKQFVLSEVQELKIKSELLKSRIDNMKFEIEEIENQIIHDEDLIWIKENQETVNYFINAKGE